MARRWPIKQTELLAYIRSNPDATLGAAAQFFNRRKTVIGLEFESIGHPLPDPKAAHRRNTDSGSIRGPREEITTSPSVVTEPYQSNPPPSTVSRQAWRVLEPLYLQERGEGRATHPSETLDQIVEGQISRLKEIETLRSKNARLEAENLASRANREDFVRAERLKSRDLRAKSAEDFKRRDEQGRQELKGLKAQLERNASERIERELSTAKHELASQRDLLAKTHSPGAMEIADAFAAEYNAYPSLRAQAGSPADFATGFARDIAALNAERSARKEAESRAIEYEQREKQANLVRDDSIRAVLSLQNQLRKLQDVATVQESLLAAALRERDRLLQEAKVAAETLRETQQRFLDEAGTRDQQHERAVAAMSAEMGSLQTSLLEKETQVASLKNQLEESKKECRETHTGIKEAQSHARHLQEMWSVQRSAATRFLEERDAVRREFARVPELVAAAKLEGTALSGRILEHLFTDAEIKQRLQLRYPEFQPEDIETLTRVFPALQGGWAHKPSVSRTGVGLSMSVKGRTETPQL